MDEHATAEASAGIDLTLAEWAAAIARGDLALLSSLVTEDAEFWTQGAAPLIGRRAVESAFKPLLETYRFSQRFDEQERCLGPDWSLLRGVEFNTLEPRRGGPPREVKQRAFSMLRRESDGRWRFARGITNQGPAEKGEGEAYKLERPRPLPLIRVFEGPLGLFSGKAMHPHVPSTCHTEGGSRDEGTSHARQAQGQEDSRLSVGWSGQELDAQGELFPT